MGDLIRKNKGWRKGGGGGEDYIPNVAIGIRNNSLIGIDQLCRKSPDKEKST